MNNIKQKIFVVSCLKRQQIHICKYGKKWCIKLAEKTKASRLYETKELAIADSRDFLPNGKIIIHNPDGSIEKIID